MIELDCPYCGHHMKVLEKYAGREGWCRECKRLIILPQIDGTQHKLEEMHEDEKVALLQKVLICAATKADIYRANALTAKEQKELSDKDVERLHGELDALEPLREDASELAALLEEQRQRSAQSEDLLEKERAEHEKLHAELQSAHDQVAEARAETFDYESELSQLREALEQMDKLECERAGNASEVEALRLESDGLSEELQTARAIAESQEGETARLEEELQEAAAEHQRMRGQLDADRKELAKAEEAREALNVELKEVREQACGFRELTEARQDELDAMRRGKEETEARIRAQSQETEVVQGQLDEAMAQEETIREQHEQTQARVRGLEDEARLLRDGADKMDEEKQQLAHEVKRLSETKRLHRAADATPFTSGPVFEPGGNGGDELDDALPVNVEVLDDNDGGADDDSELLDSYLRFLGSKQPSPNGSDDLKGKK